MQANPTCPVCLDYQPKPFVENSPYWVCGACDFWFQNPMPPKKFEADEEKGEDGRSNGHRQPKSDLDIAQNLAHAWWRNHLSARVQDSRAKLLDIGCKYPWFIKCVRDAAQGNAEVYGIDGMDQDTPDAPAITSIYSEELAVPVLQVDFEKATSQDILGKTESGEKKFDGISMIHVFEHIYDPYGGLKMLHDLSTAESSILIRVPSQDCAGFEYHLSPRHYTIHPFFYSEKSMRKLVDRSGLFEIYETYPMAVGTRDFLLRHR